MTSTLMVTAPKFGGYNQEEDKPEDTMTPTLPVQAHYLNPWQWWWYD